MLKVKNKEPFSTNITYAVKSVFLGLFFILASGFHSAKHPFYLGVVDIKQDIKAHTLNVSVKLFINDIEDALKKTSTKNIDLLNPKNKAEMEAELFAYIKKRLSINVNQKLCTLESIGYEREEEAIWTYIEIKKINTVKSIKVDTKLLYDFIPTQSNIVHAEINGVKKSSKVTNPDSKVEFNF